MIIYVVKYVGDETELHSKDIRHHLGHITLLYHVRFCIKCDIIFQRSNIMLPGDVDYILWTAVHEYIESFLITIRIT